MTKNGTSGDRVGGIELERLVAYADGVLPPEQARKVEAALRDNPDVREAVSLMRHSATAARHAFDGPLGEPVPERLRSLFDQPAGGTPPLSRRLLPMAASIAALAIGLGGGYLMGRMAETDAQIRLAAGPVESSPSAFETALLQALVGSQPIVGYTDAALEATGTIALLGTVETSFGAACREFRHVAKQSQSRKTTEDGLACPRDDGGWEVSILRSKPS